MNKRKSFPETRKSKDKEKEEVGQETQELFSEIDKNPELFKELLDEENNSEKKIKRKRKNKEISKCDSDNESGSDKENMNKKGKSAKIKKLNNISTMIEEEEESEKNSTKANTKVKKEPKKQVQEKVSKPKSKEKAPKKTMSENEAYEAIKKYMIEVNFIYILAKSSFFCSKRFG